MSAVKKLNTEAKYSKQTFLDLAHSLGKEFEVSESKTHEPDSFVEGNYSLLKEYSLFTAMIPTELGGLGMSFSDVGEFIKILAGYDASTALSFSMHQHLVAANVWKYYKGQGTEAMLRKVAENQLILISTGAKDWLDSNGVSKKVDGGYLVSGKKAFASQSIYGDILVTSAPYHDAETGNHVLHFGVPMNSKGVTVADDWYTMGMRGTGSHTVILEDVFIPESSVVLIRPQGKFHPVWSVVLNVALPLIMSVYVGIAEKSMTKTIDKIKANKENKNHVPYLLGDISNQLTTAQILLKDMFGITNNLIFDAENHSAHEQLTRKTVIAKACQDVVTKSMELVGGQSFYRSFGLERLFRDVQASQFHPLPEYDQKLFSSNFLLTR